MLLAMGSYYPLLRDARALAKTLALGLGALLVLSGVFETGLDLAALAGDGAKVDRLWSMASSSFALSATIVLVILTFDWTIFSVI